LVLALPTLWRGTAFITQTTHPKRGGDGVNWAMHRAYYIDLLKKGWPLKAAYDEAVRYTVEQEALSVTREVTA